MAADERRTHSAAETPPAVQEEDIDFARDVRPWLAQHCFACHGPDAESREAGLRLDRADSAFAELASGTRAIVPGRPQESELMARVAAMDETLRMPPESAGDRLPDRAIGVLERWIAQGARYDDHWSFRPVAISPPAPSVVDENWCATPVDRYVRAKLERAGVLPSRQADRTTLLRRLSLDLRGLPATPEEVADFLEDERPGAYERLVDRLLASPQLGERWGRHWLDLAHYADSDGYLGDTFRPYAWRYRDWVIGAVNDDLPFDRFTIEQLAGDLLPDATLDQKAATGFLRNTLRNTEAGVDLEEYRLKEIVDRVNTLGIGWMGLSLGCAECHAHKYDPISQREFYELFAFFNDADDVDVPALLPGERERYEAERKDWEAREAELAALLEAAVVRLEPVTGAPAFERRSWLEALATTARKRTGDQVQLVATLLKHPAADVREACVQYEQHGARKPAPPASHVMSVGRRTEPRVTFVHRRGDYRSRGEAVRPGTPAVLPPLAPRGAQPDRLDLARWLVDGRHPLTARVAVNHIWQHLFGRGLVATVDNFGAGGEAPSHPELLDWLAGELTRRQWSRKELIRQIVLSAAYRQSSAARDDLEQRDPLNVLIARQGRFRLEAEGVRDAALLAAGLLYTRIGGPGIRPPQPAYVASISRNVTWEVSTGPELYRRGMYIVFRRATPYPMLLTFDAPDSTQACVRRDRSNSPLQALTLLNDPVFVDAARALGRMLAEFPEADLDARVVHAFQRCVGRYPLPDERDRVREFYREQEARFVRQPAATRAI
ncbi:MAG: PSD1 and planctomycete cytochrome C domain-containing protein, partial [Pirellulaceae bacterium]